MAELGGNFSIVAQGLGAYSERVEDPNEISPALSRGIQATESGQAALIEVLIRPMPTPRSPGQLVIVDPCMFLEYTNKYAQLI